MELSARVYGALRKGPATAPVVTLGMLIVRIRKPSLQRLKIK